MAQGPKARYSSQGALPVAGAIDLALGATIWANVRVSTAGAALDITSLLGQGFYKREVIELVLLSAESRSGLFQNAEKRRKGEKLSEIAKDYKLDYDKVYEAALAVEELVDREYLPRLYKRRKERRMFE